jgi:acetoin utilization deacetylase AcuC-like enzyme
VFTLSFHYRGAGYFPGSGDVTEIGSGPGRYASSNLKHK